VLPFWIANELKVDPADCTKVPMLYVPGAAPLAITNFVNPLIDPPVPNNEVGTVVVFVQEMSLTGPVPACKAEVLAELIPIQSLPVPVEVNDA